MSMRIATLTFLLLITAACQSTVYPDNIDHGPICFERPYADAVGLDTGQHGMVTWQTGLSLYDAPQGAASAHLEPGEQFIVLEGPGCWHVPPTSNYRIDHRLWRIQSETQSVTGWVQEYGWSLIYGVIYLVEPLADDDLVPLPGQPLPAPITFTGQLQWTSIEGPLDPRFKTHAVTFDGYGFIKVTVETDDPALVNPDLYAEDAACRVIVLITPLIPPVDVVGSRIRTVSSELERLWVQPQQYGFDVGLRFIPGAVKGAAPVCPDTTYTLTITPV